MSGRFVYPRQDKIDELIVYLDRKSPYVACYALRKEHGLRNSSNKVEKANDLSLPKGRSITEWRGLLTEAVHWLLSRWRNIIRSWTVGTELARLA